MRGIVRAGVDAAGLFQMRAEIAGSSFLLDDGFLAAGIFEVVEANIEGMEIDVAIGAVARTQAAADAPIFNDDFERIAAADGANGAADHTEGIAALTAGGGNKEIFETQAVADEAGDTVVGIGAGIYAGVAARAFLQVEDEQALRFHQALREELVDRNALHHLEALCIGGLAFRDDGLQAGPDIGEARDHFPEIVAGNSDKFDVIERGAGGSACTAAKQADLAEVVAAGDVGEDEFAAGIVFDDFHKADADEVETVGGFALARDDLPGRVADEFNAVFEMVDKVGGESREHGDAAEVGFEGATTVIFIELRAEGFVLHHDVENVAQHFERDDIGFGAHGGGARIEVHAGHFTEKIAWAEFSDGIAVGEVDGSVDGDGAVAGFLVAVVFFAADENAGEAFEEALGAAMRFDVSDGSGDGDLRLAFEDVERGRAEVAFAADDFAGAETALDDGAAIEIEEGAGNSGENGHAMEFFGGEGLRGLNGSDGGAGGGFIGERAGRAGDHAFAAGDTSRIAHRGVEIEGDAGGIAFAHAAEDEIVFDFVAAADAAVAEDAGVVIDSDGEGGIVGATRSGAARKTQTSDIGLLRKSLEFAIAGMPLAGAGRRVIGHEEFEKSFARGENFVGAGADHHAGLDGTDAGGAENACAGIDDTEAANADGSLALEMAESGNRDAVKARGVEDGGASGNLDGLAVDGEFDELGRDAHLGSNPHTREFGHFRGGREADAAGTLAAKNVRIDFGAEMFEDGLDGSGNDLAESADGSEGHSLGEFVDESKIGAIGGVGQVALGPAGEKINHFLRAHAAGDALATGFVAIELDGGESHIEHAGGVVANDDGAGTEHRAGNGEGFEIEANVDHGGGEIAGGRAGGRERFELAAGEDATGTIEDDFAHGNAEGNFEDAGAIDVSGDTDEFEAAGTVGAGGYVPVDAAGENLRDVGESLDVVDGGGLLKETGLAGEGGLVAGLGAMAFDGFEERAFFAADVAAGADEHFEVKIEVAAKNFFAENTRLGATTNFFSEDLFLERIFVADIEDAFFCAGNESGDDHAFGDEMREMAEDETVLDGAGLALVGVADDVFHRIGLLADEIPLHPSGESGAAHAAELGFFENGENGVEIASGDQLAESAVFFVVGIRIGVATNAGGLRMIGMQRFATSRTASELLDVVGGDSVEDGVVDRDGRSTIAATEAADVFDLDILRAGIGETAGKFGAEFAGAVETATHVGADVNFDVGRRREMEVGIETGNAVELVQGSLRALGQRFEFGLRQIAATQLDSSQFVEDHRSVGSRMRAPAVKESERGMGLGYFRIVGRGSVVKMRGRCLFAQSPEKGRRTVRIYPETGRYKLTKLLCLTAD